jgi:hypothetical protein
MLQEFRDGSNPIMLATDVAARGLGAALSHKLISLGTLLYDSVLCHAKVLGALCICSAHPKNPTAYEW